MNEPKKHHFLPVFYLRQWANADRRLVEFKKPFGNTVVPRRGHPQSMGWIDRLYALDGVEGASAQKFETTFLSPVDSRAAEALKLIIDPMAANKMPFSHRIAWAGFLNSLLARMPSDIQKLKAYSGREWTSSIRGLREKYLVHRTPTDPPTLDDYLAAPPNDSFLNEAWLIVAEVILGHERLQEAIANMHWSVIQTDDADHELLTSDRPVLHTQSLNTMDAHLLCPIGPRKLFVAVANPHFRNYLVKWGTTALVKRVNEHVVSSADQYAFGRTDSQLRFVQNRMSTNRPESLIDRLNRKRISLKAS